MLLLVLFPIAKVVGAGARRFAGRSRSRLRDRLTVLPGRVVCGQHHRERMVASSALPCACGGRREHGSGNAAHSGGKKRELL